VSHNPPQIASLGAEFQATAAGLLWSVMYSEADPGEHPMIYDLFTTYLEQPESSRRRPVLDEWLGPPAEPRPRAIVRHDVDCWQGTEKWLEIEDKLGIRSTFLVRAQRQGASAEGYAPGRKPPDYRFDEPRVLEFVQTAAAGGWQIGLHYGSAVPAVVRREAADLRKAFEPAEIAVASAHWLESSAATIRELDRLGFAFDMSFLDWRSYMTEIGPDQPCHPGFPTGTTHPHLLWDPKQGRFLNLVAIPGALEEDFVGGRCPSKPDPQDIEKYIRYFKTYGGVLVLLWHPDRIDLIGHFENLVKQLQDAGFEFTLPADLSRPQIQGEQAAAVDPRLP